MEGGTVNDYSDEDIIRSLRALGETPASRDPDTERHLAEIHEAYAKAMRDPEQVAGLDRMFDDAHASLVAAGVVDDAGRCTEHSCCCEPAPSGNGTTKKAG